MVQKGYGKQGGFRKNFEIFAISAYKKPHSRSFRRFAGGNRDIKPLQSGKGDNFAYAAPA